MNVKTAAILAGVSSDTIRRWCVDYAQFLGPGATPGSGKTRQLSRHDAAVFRFVATLRDQGLDHHQIFGRLTDMQKGSWENLPDLPADDVTDQLDGDKISAAVAAARANELAEIAALQSELRHTRQELETAQNRAETLQQQLDTLQTENAATAGEISSLKLDLENARGDVRALQARIDAFTLAYGMGRDRPLPLAVIIGVTAVAVAVLVIVLLVVVRLVL